MTTDRHEWLIDAGAALLTMLMVATIVLFGATHPVMPPQPAAKPETITLTMAEPAPPPPPHAEPAPRAPAAPPEPVLPALAPSREWHAPPRHAHRQLAKPALTAPPPAEAPARAIPPALPAPAPARDFSAEARYTAEVKAAIERHKSNPASPAYRMMHPHGTATIGFTLLRSGAAGPPRLITGSGAALLDAQALAIVATSRFAPMPPQIFPGTAAHDFQVEITFPPFGTPD